MAATLNFDQLPLTGAGVAYRPPGHPRFVLDLVGVVGDTFRRAEVSLWRAWGSVPVERFYGWRRPVVAPAAGTVVVAHDGEPDRPSVSIARDVPSVMLLGPLRAGRGLGAMAGNHVILGLAEGYLLLAHLRQGSLAVAAGDRVAAGDPIGEVGNSGNSLAPHLHVQAMSSADPVSSLVLPWRVAAMHRCDGGRWSPAPGPVPGRVPVRTE